MPCFRTVHTQTNNRGSWKAGTIFLWAQKKNAYTVACFLPLDLSPPPPPPGLGSPSFGPFQPSVVLGRGNIEKRDRGRRESRSRKNEKQAQREGGRGFPHDFELRMFLFRFNKKLCPHLSGFLVQHQNAIGDFNNE